MSVEKWRSPIFEKKICVQIINLFVSKLQVFGHFLEIVSLDFANFAYFDRWNLYLTISIGCCSKKISCMLFLILTPSICEKMHTLLLYLVWMTMNMHNLIDNIGMFLTKSFGSQKTNSWMLFCILTPPICLNNAYIATFLRLSSVFCLHIIIEIILPHFNCFFIWHPCFLDPPT